MSTVNQLGQRNMTQLKIKTKLIVFCGSTEEKIILNEYGDKCNTSSCQYTLVPICLESMAGKINKNVIKKHIKNCVSGYIKGLDKVIIIEPYVIKQFCLYIVFDSIDDFTVWFEKETANEYINNNSERKEKVQ